MRYYDLTIYDKNGKVLPLAAMGGVQGPNETSLTSHVGERFLPGAAQIEFGITQVAEGAAQPGSYVKIWGPTLKEISEATDLHQCEIVLKGGFKKGLPLVKPEQAGVLLSGRIVFPYGNWMGTEMLIELPVLGLNKGSNFAPKNFILDWRKDTTLATALKKALQTAFPTAKLDIRISDDLKLKNDELGAYPTLGAFSEAVARLSQHQQFKAIKTLTGSGYAGVRIVQDGSSITVADDTQQSARASQSNPIEIAFEDMIGQPTWYSPSQIQVSLALRGDIRVNDHVKLPEGLRRPFVVTRPEAAPQPTQVQKFESAFKGVFRVNVVHHVGHSRSASASAWVTILTVNYGSQLDGTVPGVPTEPEEPEVGRLPKESDYLSKTGSTELETGGMPTMETPPGNFAGQKVSTPPSPEGLEQFPTAPRPQPPGNFAWPSGAQF